MKAAEPKTGTNSNTLQTKSEERHHPFFQSEKAGEASATNDTAFFSPNGGNSIQRKPFFAPPSIQPKLTIGQPGDKYEKEADQVADQVVQRLAENKTGSEAPLTAPRPAIQRKPIFESDAEPNVQTKPLTSIPASRPPVIQPKCEACEQEEPLQKTEEPGEEEQLQRKPIFESAAEPPEDNTVQAKSDSEPAATSDLKSQLSSTKGGGQPLPKDTRSGMENAFGADFSGVRVHTGSDAAQLSNDLGAQAFTHGNDIYFNEGKYDPGSSSGKGLLAHELTHTVQQGASKSNSIQRQVTTAPSTNAPTTTSTAATNPAKPTAPLDITHRFEPTTEWQAYLDSVRHNRVEDIPVKIGNDYEGTIGITINRRATEGGMGRYRLATNLNKRYLQAKGFSFLNPLRNAGVTPILVLESWNEQQQTVGFLSVKMGETPVGNVLGLIRGFNERMQEMSFLGLSAIEVPGSSIQNRFEQGRLIFQVTQLSTNIDGYLQAGGGIGITGESFTFNLTSHVSLRGLAEGDFNIARGEDGQLSGRGQIQANLANVQAEIIVEYQEGVVTIQGTGRIESDKFSGAITLLVTERSRATEMMQAALGVQTVEGQQQAAEEGAARPKTPRNQVLVGWGEVTAEITPWLVGTAKIGVDAEGHVTVVGEITVPNEVELMEQRGKRIQLVDFEIRAGYGVPLVGQVFLFGSIGLFINAGFGPLVLRDIRFEGTYSTDPSVLQHFSITGVLNINAFAILGLEAEGGVGVTLLGHDIKAGLNVTAAAGLRAYAEAQPTFEYVERAGEAGGKVGEAWLRGHFEAAAQLFLMLNGGFFVELDAPWWSPASDDRWDWPFGSVEYPIGDSMGIGADVDWLVGSDDAPELSFTPVEFDPAKFTSDVMAEPPPGRGQGGDRDEAGTWQDGEGGGNLQGEPELQEGGEGLPGQRREDLTQLPNEQRYMRGLGEIGDLADQTRGRANTLNVVHTKINRIKQKYALDTVRIEDRSDENVTIFVQHAAQNNRNNMVQVPIMSEAERTRLLAAAMQDLNAQMAARANDQDKMNRSDADAIAHAVPQNHPVIEGIRVVDGRTSWNFNVDIGDRNEQVPGKGKAEVQGEQQAPDQATGAPSNPAELSAALGEIDREAEQKIGDGEITREDANLIVTDVQRDHPTAFQSITVMDGGDTWDFEYVQRAEEKKVRKKVNRKEGGAYSDLKVRSNPKEERHHMPSKKALELSGYRISIYGNAPCVIMEFDDHKSTPSWGSRGRSHSENLSKIMIDAGNTKESLKAAQAEDIQLLSNDLKVKYSKGISEMVGYTNSL